MTLSNHDKSRLSILAFEELHKFSNSSIINKEVYLPWLKKYGNLYDTFKSHSPFHTSARFFEEQEKFHTLYRKINELAIFLSYEERFAIASSEYNSIKTSNELDLIKWLIKYEQLNDELFELHWLILENTWEESTTYLKITGLKISISDFQHQKDFVLIFNEAYWPILDKYAVKIKNEKTGEMYIDDNSLTYHINKRGISIDKLGT